MRCFLETDLEADVFYLRANRFDRKTVGVVLFAQKFKIFSEGIMKISRCEQLHQYFNSLERLDYKNINKLTFYNGISLAFERGEFYKDLDRIVWVGESNYLLERLRTLYSGDKEGNVLRKSVGAAILNKRNDPYLPKWTLDSSVKRIKSRLTSDDLILQKSIEQEISSYLQNNITFVCFEVTSKNVRQKLKRWIVAALGRDGSFCGSSKWLGLHSPSELIRNSGIWLKQCLDDRPLTLMEFNNIKNGRFIRSN